jgi:hypothetical protein
VTFPTVRKSFIKDVIDRARQEIGRDVTVHTPISSACPLCVASGYYDLVGDTSFYTVCPTCQGRYWLNTTQETEVLARVHWVGNEAINATPGGKYFVGDAQVTVDPSYYNLFKSAQNEAGKVVVDGQDMQIMQIRPMGAPEINRYRIVLRGMGNRPNT